MSDEQLSLWAPPARPAGALRAMLQRRIDQAAADGHELPEDLALVALSLADRIDTANARDERRGFVMLTAEYRAARAQLFDGLDQAGADPLDAALSEFLSTTDV